MLGLNRMNETLPLPNLLFSIVASDHVSKHILGNFLFQAAEYYHYVSRNACQQILFLLQP